MPSLSDIADRHTVIDRRDGEYICFPDVVRAGDGRLIVAYNEADKHIAPTRRALLVRQSFDNGVTWDDIRRMDVARSHCPRLSRLANGEIILSDSTSVFHRSFDNGDTWETHPVTGLKHDMIDRVIDLGDDVFITTGHGHRGKAAQPAIRQAPAEQMLYRSEDRGHSWLPVSVIGRERNLVLCEASMVALPDGRIAALMRENSFVFEPMYLCFSSDQGETWSDPVPTPLVGHRPTMGLTSAGDLLVTYRNVGPSLGTCAWLGSLEELTSGFRVHGRSTPDNPNLTPDGLRVQGGEGMDEIVRYALRPMTDPRFARATLEAEVRVDAAGKNGCGLRMGTWWKITPDAISFDVEDATPIAIEPGRFHTIGLDYEEGKVTLNVDGEQRAAILVERDHADSRAMLFGAPYPFEDNAVDCTWKRVSLTIEEPRLGRDDAWHWKATDGLPDAWTQDRTLELKADRKAAPPDFGYSGWIELEDGSFYCAYHHGGSDEAGYDPMFTAYVMGTRFTRDDFK